ncbi:MAG: S8 family serine peptidase [Chloroflexi bacterium]|nr:S8 family serine peptidase [Chloroflexota bacterium]
MRKTYALLCILLFASLTPPRSAAIPPTPSVADVAYWQQALGEPHAPNEILMQFRPHAYLGLSSRPTALASAAKIKEIPDLGLLHYQIQGDMASILAQLNADPHVEFAEPNYLIYPTFRPNDPYYVNYAGNVDVANGGYLTRMNMEAAWDLTRGRSEIIVAVIDTGIDLDHEDLEDALWTNPGEIPDNSIDDDDNGFVDDVYGWDFAAETANVNDWFGHGSHVAGIIAARANNGKGIAGMAPKTRVMALGVFAPPGFGAFADEVEAILYAADHGAKVINLSLGSNAYSRGEQMAIEYAVRRGIIVVAAAGNDYRELYHWPAAHDAAIAVAATTAYDTRAPFSNLGDFVDLAAPGATIKSLGRTGGYVLKGGTSMSAPHVAGLAALILARNPTLAPAEVRAIMETTATDLGAPGWDKEFGKGRIDALAALQATPLYTDTFPSLMPDWLQTAVWPPLCNESVVNGDFEKPLHSSWHVTGTASITDVVSMTGGHSLFLTGTPERAGSATQTIAVPSDLHAATLAFGLRVENDDLKLGEDPEHPWRDYLNIWLRTADGDPILELMRAGNADFDLASSLAWDRYLHVLSVSELALLRETGEVQLWFYADNGPDPKPTRFYIDSVRFCTAHAPMYLPHILVQ